jgi:hypothetical protein
MDIKTELREPRAKRGQFERINIDMGSIEPIFCGRKLSIPSLAQQVWPASHWEGQRGRQGRAR